MTPTPEPEAGIAVSLSARDIENLMMAAKLVALSNGFGHGPGGLCKKGERIAGFYYLSNRAAEREVMPAHCVGAMRNLVIDLQEKVHLARAQGED